MTIPDLFCLAAESISILQVSMVTAPNKTLDIRPPIFMTLGAALRDVRTIPFGYALYLPPDETWSFQTRCGLFDPDDVGTHEQAPAAATQTGLQYALGIGTVKEICENLHQQTISPSDDMLLEAFLFYYDNDAFIVVP